MNATPQFDADEGFIGIDMRTPPAMLAPGWASEAVNMRFRNGVAETRFGYIRPVWLNKIVGGVLNAYNTIYGVTEEPFSDPVTAFKYDLIAADGNVYLIAGNNPATALSLPAGVTITGPVKFVQCFNVVVMLRGPLLAPLVLKNITTGFEAIGTARRPTSILLPSVTRALHLSNRLLALNGDILWTSDLLDYTSGSIFDDFRINQGSADRLLAAKPFGTNTVICYKDYSVYRVDGVFGDLSQVQLSLVTKRFGIVAPDSAVDTGGDNVWLCAMGVASLRLTEFGEIQAAGDQSKPVPMLSAPIQPLIDRINWKYAANAVGVLWDNKYYLAVPFDDATILGHDLVGSALLYDAAGSNINVPTVAGRTYRYVKGGHESDLLNGTETITQSQDFIAQGSFVTMTNPGTPVSVTASIKTAFVGVNNAVLVYDFLNQAWCGHDEGNGLMVKYWSLGDYQGRQRLRFASPDGWMHLYEEDYLDAEFEPYTDVIVTTAPANGNTCRVNGGTIVTSTISLGNLNQAPNLWGTGGTLAQTRVSFTTDVFREGGYAITSGNPWTKPNTTAVSVTSGMRFYSVNDTWPTIVTTGTWATVTDSTRTYIQSKLVTRGYRGAMAVAPGYRVATDRSRLRALSVQLQTWKPKYSLTAIAEGVQEETAVVTDQTRSRTQYDRPFDKAPWDATNVNDDFLTPYRQDYSLVPGTAGFKLQTNGVRCGVHQEVTHRVQVNQQARATQIKITASQGRIRVMAVRAEMTVGERRKGVLT